MSEYSEESRIAALAAHLSIELEDGEDFGDYITEASYGENTFEAEGNEYLVLTDSEADDAAREYIENSLWAFNAEFLAGNTGLPEEVFTALQDKCEDANDTFWTLVNKCGDFGQLVRDAIASDGRGHFLAQYDGAEEEEGEFYIFRTN